MELLTQEEYAGRLAALKGLTYPVLSDGHVQLVDVMGGDQDIVDAARISYGKGTKRAQEDRHLIRYLMRQWHTTPFEMVEFKFRVRVPMDAWRQWIRHRTANVNEYSTRYSEAIDSNDVTPTDGWRLQSGTNKQGSGGTLANWPEGYGNNSNGSVVCESSVIMDFDELGRDVTPGEYLSKQEQKFHKQAQQLYKERLDFGVAKEQARKDLPLSTYTEAYWKCDLHNVFNFLRLRMHPHAQKEIRDYAFVIGQLVRDLCPVAWEAFEDYRLKAVTFSSLECFALYNLMASHSQVRLNAKNNQREMILTPELILGSWQPSDWRDPETALPLKKCRERDEFISKLDQMGFLSPQEPLA